MSFVFRIKRRLEGEAGPPPVAQSGELSYNEVEDTLYIGVENITQTEN
jgi:hypothetical protein